MCRGTIKILKTHGCIEPVKDAGGLTIVIGSPERAGQRLHQQAMDSLMKKQLKTLEVQKER